MTFEQLKTLYIQQDHDAINKAYAGAPADLQSQMLIWLNEIKNPDEALAEIGDTLEELEKQDEKELDLIAAERRRLLKEFQEASTITPEEKTRQANILRAKRANLKRRLSKKFRPYIPFTAKHAAEAIGANEQILENYLKAESAVIGREIVAVPEIDGYMLIDLFA